MTFASKNIHLHARRGSYLYPAHFSDSDPRTPIQTIIENLVTPLAEHGGVDVFIYQSFPQDIPINMENIKKWNGDPLTYQPYPGDTRACELYSKHAVFAPQTGNKVFCYTEFSRQLRNYFVLNNDGWNKYEHPSEIDKEALLQQEYGKYIANLGANQYSVASGIKYKYKIRLRFDEAMSKRFPDLSTFNFTHYDVTLQFKDGKRAVNCENAKSIIYFPNFFSHGDSAEDSFNFGLSEDMDKIFDHYLYLLTKPILPTYLGSPTPREHWINEHNQIELLKKWFGICLTEHRDIHITKVRRNDYDRNRDRSHLYFQPPSFTSNWVLVNHNGTIATH